MMKRLLKIGTLNIPADRWNDALEYFDEILVFTIERELNPLSDRRFIYKSLITSDTNSLLRRFILKLYSITHTYKQSRFLNLISLNIVLILKFKLLRKIASYNTEIWHSSYNDFDDSNFLTCLLCFFKKKEICIVKSYKESRPEYNYLEYKNLDIAKLIVLNDKLNLDFFKKKYANMDWEHKSLKLGLDEDWRSFKYQSLNIKFNKYSQIDGKLHVVILAGRVLSDSTDKRSGGRLYYIDMIEDFVKVGLIVHLHTSRRIPDKDNIDRYEKLVEEYPNSFFIEKPLNFIHTPIDAYKILGRYDFGILHNSIKGTSVSDFDQMNIPHRFYEYQIAHVVPIVKRGDKLVLEHLFVKDKVGVIYDSVKDLVSMDISTIVFKCNSFKDFIKILYGK